VGKIRDGIALQNAEFHAAVKLAEQYQRITLTAVVDDDWPAFKFAYDQAADAFLRAAVANGRRIPVADPERKKYAAPLSFDQLRQANMLRLPQFRNAHGKQAHSEPDGSDWDRAAWLEAMVGEVGEYANFSKKYRRGDISEGEFMLQAQKELADVLIYLDLLAFNLGIDLTLAVRSKFNEVSERVGSDVRL
jgi:NTP pyrophosphatase (non-canonical NTP hydrolase)